MGIEIKTCKTQKDLHRQVVRNLEYKERKEIGLTERGPIAEDGLTITTDKHIAILWGNASKHPSSIYTGDAYRACIDSKIAQTIHERKKEIIDKNPEPQYFVSVKSQDVKAALVEMPLTNEVEKVYNLKKGIIRIKALKDQFKSDMIFSFASDFFAVNCRNWEILLELCRLENVEEIRFLPHNADGFWLCQVGNTEVLIASYMVNGHLYKDENAKIIEI